MMTISRIFHFPLIIILDVLLLHADDVVKLTRYHTTPFYEEGSLKMSERWKD